MFCERINQTGVLVEAECLKMDMQKSEYTSVLKNNSVFRVIYVFPFCIAFIKSDELAEFH